MALGMFELLIVVVGLMFSLAPLALAIWALVTASGLRKQVAALEQRVQQLEAAPHHPPTA